MGRNEKETREQLIDPKLKGAGWNVLKTKGIIEKNTAGIEISVTGMPKTSANPSGNGFVDYVMFGDDGKPLALVEAKKSVNNEEQGRVQACLYADALEVKYGVRPIIYYTNGYKIKIIDGIYPAREVFGFHRKDELEFLIQRRSFNLTNKKPNPNICGRYYQMDAIEEILNHLGKQHARSLIVLATGTGKTRVSCGLSDIFIKNNFVKRILFLADRKNLVVQAKEETFEKFMPSVPMAAIIEGKRIGADDARIVFSTYQSMLSLIKDTSNCPFGIGHFDLIIVDEAHRSLFNKYGEIFEYFDSLMIGLTATPRNDIHKSTYKVFNLDNDAPNYEYDLVRGVKDGYLTYFRALDRTPDILRSGVAYDELSEEEQEQYEDLFTDDDGNIPEKIEGSQFYSIITNRDTIRAVIRDLMEEGLRVDGGDRLGKTIIFARDHNHAVMIQEEFRLMYPELCIPNGKNGVDYCVVIDNRIKYNEVLQREFKYGQDIRIVVSVDMMDTGVDVPEVVNLVFFKKVLSKIKFWQMIGRGTRLCDNIKVMSPSKAYFERTTNDTTRQLYNSKQGFLIFDVCGAFSFFKLNPDGREDHSSDILSLNQKIYLESAALYKQMQKNYAKLDSDDSDYYPKLRTYLAGVASNMNRNYIGVQKNLKIIEKYSDEAAWYSFAQPNFIEIKKCVAPNVTGNIDVECARFFDYLCVKFSTEKFIGGAKFASVAKALYTLADYLLKFKMKITEVTAKKDILEYIISNSFLLDTTVVQMENIRKDIRDLMRYIERYVYDPIVSDFEDAISIMEDAEEEAVSFAVTVDDFKTYKEKIEFFILTNQNMAAISKIRNLQPVNLDEFNEIKCEFLKISKCPADFENLFGDDSGIIPMIRRTVSILPEGIDNFLQFWINKGCSSVQIAYIKELLAFVSQNGCFSRSDLVREGFSSFVGIFDSTEILEVIERLEAALRVDETTKEGEE